MLHLLLVVNVGLPLQRFKGQKSNSLEVTLLEKSSNKMSAEEKLPQAIPIPIKENSLPSDIKVPPPIIKSVINDSKSISSKTESLVNIAPQEAPKQNEIQAVEQPQTSLLASDQQSTPATVVDIEFDIVSGNDGKIMSHGLQHFMSEGSENYQLTSKSAQSENSNNGESWQIGISGRLFGNALKPSVYYFNGKLAEQLVYLSRISKNGEVITARPKRGTMQDGILDRQSLWYYFMFSPPTDQDSEILLSDGAKISKFNMHLVKVEFLDTALGRLNTAHITLLNFDNNESIEMWLAPNYKYLPVKVRYSDSDGTNFVQLVKTLSIK
jgi:hypothetical protein